MTDNEFKLLLFLNGFAFALLFYMNWNVLRILMAMGTTGELRSFDRKAIWNVLRVLVARSKDGQFKKFPLVKDGSAESKTYRKVA
jgi:hypothetical protein